jgi:hypothetical protein
VLPRWANLPLGGAGQPATGELSNARASLVGACTAYPAA